MSAMLKIFLLTLAIVAVAILLLGVRIFFTKKGKFPNLHVGGNKALADKGIYCVQTQDMMERKGINGERKKKSDKKKSNIKEN